MLRRAPRSTDLPGFFARFGAGGPAGLARAAREVLGRRDGHYAFGASTLGFARPDLALPAYAGLVPDDGLAPIYHFFDRASGGHAFRGKVTRTTARDYRGGRLTYDEHDGTDFVCPAGTTAVAAAPGVLVAVRDRFLRGGLTASVDHGGVITQYTHLAKVTAGVGQALERGEPLGLTGHSGFDMAVGFPWVPPHLHFMVWVLGQPVDPFLSGEEDEHAGSWLFRNDPRSVEGRVEGDPAPLSLDDIEVCAPALEEALRLCLDPEIAAEIGGAMHPATRLALLEDSLHHDRAAWPDAARSLDLRPSGARTRARLSLPLSPAVYRGAKVADVPWTRP